MEVARGLPRAICELDNHSLYVLAMQGCHEANFERLAREIMVVDNVDWFEAATRAHQVQIVNRRVLFWGTLPFKIGFGTAVLTGVGAMPLVFHRETAKWFNAKFVHMEVPPQEELETILEVGSWTWNFMEPVLGTASFCLLAAQFGRAQMLNMDMSPYTTMVRKWRARRLRRLYPQYDKDIVGEFAWSASLRNAQDNSWMK